MDLAALVRAGRQSEAIASLEPASNAGSYKASHDLAIVYRWLGDPRLEQFYALRSYQQDPSSVIGLASLLRTLIGGGQNRLATDIYDAHPSKGGLSRDHHLNAALAYCRINRIAQADDALARCLDYPREDIRELEIAAVRASVEPDHPALLRILDRLEALGVEVEDRRVWALFAASEAAAALRRFETYRDVKPAVAAMEKVALFCALLVDERETVTALATRIRGEARALADLYLAETREVEIRGASRTYRFPFNPGNLSVAMPHAEGQFYEIESLRRLKTLLVPGDQVVDVGANIGNHTVYFAGEAGCRVLPFECNPRLVAQLSQAVDNAGLRDLVDLARLGTAVSDAAGHVDFNFLRDDFSNISKAQGAGATRVPAIALDSLELASCRLLKIDVDGGERMVLDGAERFIATLRPVIAIEVSNFNTPQVLAFMQRHDYVIVREDFQPAIYSDFLFAPAGMELPAR